VQGNNAETTRVFVALECICPVDTNMLPDVHGLECQTMRRPQVPIYMTGGMAGKAAALYATLSEWCSQGVQLTATSGRSSLFTKSRFQLWKHDLMHQPGPCVLFATPAMLHGGTSLRVFKEWAPEKDNLVLLPGYCTAGTVGNMLMGGMKRGAGKSIQLDKDTQVHVRCKVCDARVHSDTGLEWTTVGRIPGRTFFAFLMDQRNQTRKSISYKC
jgi:Cft2 family RNA processing exonuclease